MPRTLLNLSWQRRPSTSSAPRRLWLEPLEARLAPACATSSMPPVFSVNCQAAADVVVLSIENAGVRVTLNGTDLPVLPFDTDFRISGTAGGAPALRIFDTVFAGVETYTLTAADVRISTLESKYQNFIIRYTSVQQLAFSSGAGPNTFFVRGTASATPVQLNAGADRDIINVQANAGLVTVRPGSGADTINVGSAGDSLDPIQGRVVLESEDRQDTLNLRDRGAGVNRFYEIAHGAVRWFSGSGPSGPVAVKLCDADDPMANCATARLEGSDQGAFFGVDGPGPGNPYVPVDLFLIGGTLTDFYYLVTPPIGFRLQIADLGGDDFLLAANQVNTFQILQQDNGRLTSAGFSQYPTTFSNVEHLFGGADKDTFAFNGEQRVSGILFGSDGSDTLNLSAYQTGVNVNLLFGVGTGAAAYLGLENVVGGSGNDILHGDDGPNDLTGGLGHDILVGHGGADLLVGGLGRDLLFGGLEGDRLEGGADEDVLFDGVTLYDYLDSLLLDLLGHWTSQGPYGQRVQVLRAFLNVDTVFSDGVADQLLGGQDLDWFWAEPLDTTDRVQGEFLN